MDNSQLVELIVMSVLLITITVVGSVALYRAKRPGWWLPIVVMLFLFGWPWVKNILVS